MNLISKIIAAVLFISSLFSGIAQAGQLQELSAYMALMDECITRSSHEPDVVFFGTEKNRLESKLGE